VNLDTNHDSIAVAPNAESARPSETEILLQQLRAMQTSLRDTERELAIARDEKLNSQRETRQARMELMEKSETFRREIDLARNQPLPLPFSLPVSTFSSPAPMTNTVTTVVSAPLATSSTSRTLLATSNSAVLPKVPAVVSKTEDTISGDDVKELLDYVRRLKKNDTEEARTSERSSKGTSQSHVTRDHTKSISRYNTVSFVVSSDSSDDALPTATTAARTKSAQPLAVSTLAASSAPSSGAESDARDSKKARSRAEPRGQKVPVYDGTSSWEHFIYEFESVMVDEQWSDVEARRKMRRALKGNAARVLYQNPSRTFSSYEELKNLIECRQKENVGKLMHTLRLAEVPRRRGEDVRAYADRLFDAAARVEMTPDERCEALRSAFLHGVKADVELINYIERKDVQRTFDSAVAISVAREKIKGPHRSFLESSSRLDATPAVQTMTVATLKKDEPFIDPTSLPLVAAADFRQLSDAEVAQYMVKEMKAFLKDLGTGLHSLPEFMKMVTDDIKSRHDYYAKQKQNRKDNQKKKRWQANNIKKLEKEKDKTDE